MSYVYVATGWLFGLVFALMGLLQTLSYPLASVALLLAACFLLPPIRQFVFSKLRKELQGGARAAIVFVLFLTFGGLVTVEEQWANKRAETKANQAKASRIEREKQSRQAHFNSTREQILSRLNTSFKNQDYKKVMKIAEIYLEIGDPEVQSIYDQSRQRLEVTQRERKIETLVAKLAYLPDSEVKENAGIYRQLAALKPDNDTYKEKYAHYNGILMEQRRVAKAKAQAELEKQEQQAARKKLIAKQFSSWDGSHYNLTQYIKNNMNDPKSYDHVETRFGDMGSYVVVVTTFRGKNAFGGVVKQTYRAKVDLEGNIIEAHSL